MFTQVLSGPLNFFAPQDHYRGKGSVRAAREVLDSGGPAKC